MRYAKYCLFALLCLVTACARTRRYDDHRWQCMKLYDGKTRKVEELAMVVVEQPLFVINVRDLQTDEHDAAEVDEIAEKDRMLELLPDEYFITLSYREHNVMNETVRYGEPLTVKFKAKTNHVYRVIVLEEFDKELDEEFEWVAGLQDTVSEEIVSVPVLLKATAKSAAEATQKRLSEMGSSLNLKIITNKQGRVEFRAIPKK